MKKNYWLPLLFSLVFIAGLIIGTQINSSFRIKSHGQEKLMKVLDLITDEYVDEIDIDSLVEMAIPALLSNLDPHSSYISPKDYETVTSELEGKITGIGISFRILNDTLNVIEIVSGGPAEKMGMQPGDRIIKVDDKDIAGQNITDNEAISMLRGEKGTHVKLTVKRANSRQPLTFELVRDDIPTESIDAAYMIKPNVGYIKVARFARNTYQEFLQALNKLRLEGAESYVVDLRGNGGGYMDPAVLMANEFLKAGDIIVSTIGRKSSENQIICADGTGSFQDSGLVVLINEFTASSSEIFSGAIQDNDRGWVIGRRSFGKGLVQRPIVLPDSSEVRLTVQRYYTPSGRSIQKDYTRGDILKYDAELINRFNNGEVLSADSVKLKLDEKFITPGGRNVYGGGGIMPDIFVPEDTSKVTSYYVNVFNQNMPIKFAYEYCDLNRSDLEKASNLKELLKKLPSDDILLSSFVQYASMNGIPARWYYINISAPLIVNQIKALIARNILGLSASYEVLNTDDKTLIEAMKYASKPVLDEEK